MSYTISEKRQIFNKTGGKCSYCDKKLNFDEYGNKTTNGAWEVDHKFPQAKGGSDNMRNLAPIHPWCNKIKSDNY